MTEKGNQIHIGRSLPPAAAPLFFRDILNGLRGLVNGTGETERFRDELKKYFGVRHCFLVSSGKAALTLLLKALHDLHPQRNEVVIPAFTCYSVPASVLRAGMKIRLCDTDPRTLDFNISELQEYFQTTGDRPISRLLAVLPTHLFGRPAEIDTLRDLVTDRNLTIIEDAAQAMGGRWQGKKLGTLGDAGFFSLDRGKAFSTVEGGVIVTNHDDLAGKISKRLNQLADYSRTETIQLVCKAFFILVFQRPSLFWIPRALPFLGLGKTVYDPDFRMRRFSPFAAGLARNWRSRLEKFRKIRRKNCNNLALFLEKSLNIYCTDTDTVTEMIRLPVFLNDQRQRAETIQRSKQQGLGIMPAYPTAVNGISALRNIFKGQEYPGAELLSKSLLTLPIHPFVTKKDIQRLLAANGNLVAVSSDKGKKTLMHFVAICPKTKIFFRVQGARKVDNSGKADG